MDCHLGTQLLNQGKKKHVNINKFAGLSRDWVGPKILFMCFFRVIPYGGEKTQKQKSPKTPGTTPGKFCLRVFLFMCFFVFRSLLRGGKDPHTPKISALLRKRPVVLKANFVLTKDRKRPHYGHFCGKMHRGLVVKRPWVLSKVQMPTLVLGVGVFSLLPKLTRQPA